MCSKREPCSKPSCLLGAFTFCHPLCSLGEVSLWRYPGALALHGTSDKLGGAGRASESGQRKCPRSRYYRIYDVLWKNECFRIGWNRINLLQVLFAIISFDNVYSFILWRLKAKPIDVWLNLSWFDHIELRTDPSVGHSSRSPTDMGPANSFGVC